jgi:hypothetical protein
MILVESDCNPGAVRYEPHYKWYCYPKYYARNLGHTLETEKALQRFSYGLLQVMGANCRKLGMAGSLHLMFIPGIGLRVGCEHLHKEYRRYASWPDAISAYNQGNNRKKRFRPKEFKNQAYVDKVLNHARRFGMDI